MRPSVAALFPAIVLFSGCASGSSLQPTAVPEISPTAPDLDADTAPLSLESRLDAEAPRWLSTYDVPSVAVALIEDGALRWTRVYGEQFEGVPATPHTLYNVASLAKPVFAEMILRLVGDGRVDLEESLAAHWVDPDIANDPRQASLTPRIALSHRTGFANWRRATDGKLTFQFAPGERFGYSGEGYEYLSRFVQRKSGETLDALARAYVFGPLGMTGTAFAEQEWFAERLAAPQGPEGQYGEPSTQVAGNAADDLHTTIGDFGAFIVGVMNHEGLSAHLAMQRDSIHSVVDNGACNRDVVARCPERIGYGLGWFVFEYPDDRILWHNGGDWGEMTLAFYSMRRREGAVIFTNGANGRSVIVDAVEFLFPESPLTAFLKGQR